MSKGKRAAKRRLDENMGFECILLYLVDGFNPSAKYQSVVSWDDYYKYGKIKNKKMFQATNQVLICIWDTVLEKIYDT